MKKSRYLLLSVIAMLVMTGCGGSEWEMSLDYIPVKTSKNAKWGFVGPDGKMLYEEEFEKMPSPVLNGYFTVEESGGYSVYKADAAKPELVPGCEDLYSVGIMSDGLIPVTCKGERIKLVDGNGKEKYTFNPVDGKEIVSVANYVSGDRIMFTTSDNMSGLVTTGGKVVIPAKYDKVEYSAEGMYMAYLKEADDNGNIRTKSILFDDSGKEIKTFRDVILVKYPFVGGKAMVQKGEEGIPGYIDSKGEFTKLSPKIKDFGSYFNGKEFIFENEDHKYGLMNLEGEVLIRPKYETLRYYTDGKYYAENGKSKWIVLSGTGEKEKTFDDFEEMISMGLPLYRTKFQVIASEGHHQIDLYDYEGKPVSNESFYSINLDIDTGNVKSDYFNASDIGVALASAIEDNGVAGISFGSPVSKVLPVDADARSYVNGYSVNIPDLHGGLKWTLTGSATTTEPIATAVSSGFWSMDYHFNNATVTGFELKAYSPREFVDEAVAAFNKTLADRGFKKEVPADGMLSVLSKGEIRVMAYTDGNSSSSNTLRVNVTKNAEVVPDSQNVAETAGEAPASGDTSAPAVASASASGNSGYLNKVCKTRLTPDDLKGVSKADIRLMRNTIFAAHGRRFKSKDLQQYFSGFSWYKPTRDEVPPAEFSEIETRNLELLKKYE